MTLKRKAEKPSTPNILAEVEHVFPIDKEIIEKSDDEESDFDSDTDEEFAVNEYFDHLGIKNKGGKFGKQRENWHEGKVSEDESDLTDDENWEDVKGSKENEIKLWEESDEDSTEEEKENEDIGKSSKIKGTINNNKKKSNTKMDEIVSKTEQLKLNKKLKVKQLMTKEMQKQKKMEKKKIKQLKAREKKLKKEAKSSDTIGNETVESSNKVSKDSQEASTKQVEVSNENLSDNEWTDDDSEEEKTKSNDGIENEDLDGKSSQVDFDDSDTSDEEDLRNTTGNIPMNWYDQYKHLGYGLDGLPIWKPEQLDSLDKFINRMENDDLSRTVYDKQTGQNIRLSDSHLELVKRLVSCRVPMKHDFMEHELMEEYLDDVRETPVSGRAEDKRSFVPPKWQILKIRRIARLLRKGVYQKMWHNKLGHTHLRRNPCLPKEFFDAWAPLGEFDEKIKKIHDNIPAPRMPLPKHSDSYNPPAEYLMNKKDVQILKENKGKSNQLFNKFWRKFRSIRDIPMYGDTVEMIAGRLMDLYLAPRKKLKKITKETSSKALLPEMPKKLDLRPYPTMEGIVYEGHRSIIRSISLHPLGKYLASGSDDCTVKIWEVMTGRCVRTFDLGSIVRQVCWNPNPKLFLLAVALEFSVVMLCPESYLEDKVVINQTNAVFKLAVSQGDYVPPPRIASAVTWRRPTEDEWALGYRVVLDHFHEVKKVVWHRQGDYLSTVLPKGYYRSVLIHQLSRWRSQVPFSKMKAIVQTTAFHPTQPILFVVTQRNVRVYNLKRQMMVKKVQTRSNWISDIALHPSGEHFLISCYDNKLYWYEMECTSRPHQLRMHNDAVRAIDFHRKYPLFASAGDDKRLVTYHATIYNDWVKDPTIVPLKQLKGHSLFDTLYVLDVKWHPSEPFLFSAGADGTVRMWH